MWNGVSGGQLPEPDGLQLVKTIMI